MSAVAHSPARNRLLATLDGAARERLFPHLEPLILAQGDVLHEPGDAVQHVWFPVDALVSLLYVMEDGASVGFAVTGNDGMAGISLFLGGETTPFRAMVQGAGAVFRLQGQLLLDALERNKGLRDVLLHYTQALLTQAAQTAVCNRQHAVEQQLCRWLLLLLDRVPSNRLAMTQELIAANLGVRREAITVAARKLRTLGVIEYSRGHIVVHDRTRLEALSCECYGVVKQEADRLLRLKPDISAEKTAGRV